MFWRRANSTEIKQPGFKLVTGKGWGLAVILHSCDLVLCHVIIFTVMRSSLPSAVGCVSLAKWSQRRTSPTLSHSLSVSGSSVSQARASVGGKTPQCHQWRTGKPRYLNKALKCSAGKQEDKHSHSAHTVTHTCESKRHPDTKVSERTLRFSTRPWASSKYKLPLPAVERIELMGCMLGAETSQTSSC